MKDIVTSVVKSPILHFVLLGVLAFVAYTHLKPADPEIIRITTRTTDALIQQQQSINQNPNNADERQTLIERHIEYEILLNEWRGPIESFRGIHYVRVTAEHEPELPPFEKTESYLRADYLLQNGC